MNHKTCHNNFSRYLINNRNILGKNKNWIQVTSQREEIKRDKMNNNSINLTNSLLILNPIVPENMKIMYNKKKMKTKPNTTITELRLVIPFLASREFHALTKVGWTEMAIVIQEVCLTCHHRFIPFLVGLKSNSLLPIYVM